MHFTCTREWWVLYFYCLKAILYKCALNSCLNFSNVLDSLMLFGSSVHSVAATWLNDLAAKVLYFTGSTLVIIPALFDHIFSLFGLFISTRSVIYFGAVLIMPLYMIVSILNWIHCFIGKQWKSISALVVLEYFKHCNTSIVHMFCTDCYLSMDFCGRPYSSALP